LPAPQIAIVVCATGALCAPLYTSQFKLATMLTLASLHAVALCQYVGCCGATGSDRYFVERLVGASNGFWWLCLS
jgi:hypothetical protein